MLLSLPWPKVFAGASGWFSSYTIRPRLIKQEVSAFNFLSGARVNFTLTVYHHCTTSCGDNGDGVGGKACGSLQKKRTFRPDSNHWLLAEWNAPRSVPPALKPLWLSIVWCRFSWRNRNRIIIDVNLRHRQRRGVLFFVVVVGIILISSKRRRWMKLVVHSCVDAPIKSAV